MILGANYNPTSHTMFWYLKRIPFWPSSLLLDTTPSTTNGRGVGNICLITINEIDISAPGSTVPFLSPRSRLPPPKYGHNPILTVTNITILSRVWELRTGTFVQSPDKHVRVHNDQASRASNLYYNTAGFDRNLSFFWWVSQLNVVIFEGSYNFLTTIIWIEWP